MSKELTDSMKNKTLPDGNYFCRTKLHCIDVFQYYDDNFFAFADANPIYYIDEVLAPCDYNHFVELTEKVKGLEETSAKAAEIAQAASDDNEQLHQLLKECGEWITDVQYHCYLGIGMRFDKSVDLLTKIKESAK